MYSAWRHNPFPTELYLNAGNEDQANGATDQKKKKKKTTTKHKKYTHRLAKAEAK